MGAFILRLEELQTEDPSIAENVCLLTAFSAVNLRLDSTKTSPADKGLYKIYDALFGKISAGEHVTSAARNLVQNLEFDILDGPVVGIPTGNTGVCHKAAPQLDLNTCRAFGSSGREKKILADLKQWSNVEEYVPAECLVPCADEEIALRGEMLYSDKYKFVWLQPPRAMGKSLNNLLLQWLELEVKSAVDISSNHEMFRDYTVISSTREPLRLFQSRLKDLHERTGGATGEYSAIDIFWTEQGDSLVAKKQLGGLLSKLVQQIWPGCGNIESLLAMDMAPVFLQFGGRKIDFLVRDEWLEEDLQALWNKLGVSKNVSWPRLVHKAEEIKDGGMLLKTLEEHIDIRKAFCSIYSVDFICFGYESKFNEICGSIDPTKIQIIDT